MCLLPKLDSREIICSCYRRVSVSVCSAFCCVFLCLFIVEGFLGFSVNFFRTPGFSRGLYNFGSRRSRFCVANVVNVVRAFTSQTFFYLSEYSQALLNAQSHHLTTRVRRCLFNSNYNTSVLFFLLPLLFLLLLLLHLFLLFLLLTYI